MIQAKKKSVAVFFGLLIYVVCISAQNNSFYFFTNDDIDTIRKSSKTEWGRLIVDSLRRSVDERLKHPMEVPMLEGGHGHDYFCPVHNKMFSFDWHKATAHYCSQCGKDWTKVNKYNWAWVNEVHSRNLNFLVSNMYLYLATNEKQYAEYIRDMMLDYASKYPTYMVHNVHRKQTNGYSGKMFGQSLDESVWASYASRAYQVAKPVMSTADIKTIEKGYLNECANMLLARKAKGNWQVWHNSGLIALGVALQNDSIINIALNDPDYGYSHLLNTDVYDDGWWNEGSPIYHYYPLRAMLLSADAVRCRNINLFDKKMYNMFAAPASAVYSDLYFPAHNDGWYGESLIDQARLYELAYKRFNDSFFLDVLKRCYRDKKRNSAEALLNNINIDSQVISNPRKSLYFENTGFAVLCSHDKTVVLKYGPHGGLHGHPDKLSISIHDGEKEIVSDMGTTAYGVPDCEEWYRKTLSHSTLSVDAKNQSPTVGKLLKFEAYNNGGFVQAEANDAYSDVNMSRSLLFRNNKLIDVFTAISDTEHVYDYVIMLTEKPVFQQNGTPVILDDSEVYKRISNTQKRTGHKIISFKVRNAEVKIQSLVTSDFEIITGEAPGIPHRDSSIESKDRFAPSYPLIVRTKNKNMKIEVTWNMK